MVKSIKVKISFINPSATDLYLVLFTFEIFNTYRDEPDLAV